MAELQQGSLMATVTKRTPRVQTDERFVLHNIDWKTYTTIQKALGDRPVRLTYDGRDLELMSPSPIHEGHKHLFGRLLDALTLELNIPVRGGGSTTFRRKRVRRGLEPDACYWIQNEPAVRGKKTIDLKTDPPPDLFIEIDITSSSLDRLAICAKLRIPEVWRFDGQALQIQILQPPDIRYALSERSLCLPFLNVPELLPFLSLDDPTDETTRIRRFVEWVRREYGNRGH